MERWTILTVHTDVWMDPADDPRENGTELDDERSVLVEYVRVHRLTMEMKCAYPLTGQLARRSVPNNTTNEAS